MVFHRNDALARCFCWFCCVLGNKRMGVDYMLDKAALTQMTTAIKRKLRPVTKQLVSK